MNNTKPLISVVMPVYNAGEFLVEALESILRQTYQNFEFIIIDDASTDNSYEILKRYQKKYPRKIRLFQNTCNYQQAATVNCAIKRAKGDFIARMDADDIAPLDRLEKQLTYLLAHKKTIAVGGQCKLIDRQGKRIGEKRFPMTYEDVYRYSFQFIPLQQPTMMIAKKRLPENFSYYDHGMSPVEDVEFIFKLFQYGKIENMSDYLLSYRIHGKNTSLVNFRKSFILTLIMRIRGIFLYGYKPTPLGVAVTLAQTVIAVLLPQRGAYFLYMVTRKGLHASLTAGITETITTIKQTVKSLPEPLLYKLPAFLR